MLPNRGSSGAIKAVLAGAIEIGVTSRPLTAIEVQAEARPLEFGRTPFVFTVARTNGTVGVDTQELADIYAGRKMHWSDDSRLRRVLRPIGDTDNELVDSLSPALREAHRGARQRQGMSIATTDQEAAQQVERVPGALGTSTLALILAEQRQVRALSLNGVAPTAESIADGRYPLQKSAPVRHRTGRDARQPRVHRLRAVRGEPGDPGANGALGQVARDHRRGAMMGPSALRTPRLFGSLVAVVVSLVALVPPLGYFSLGYGAIASALQTETEVKAEIIGQAINASPEMWRFEEHRLRDMLVRFPIELDDEQARVLGSDGEVIAASPNTVESLAMTRSTALFDAGVEVGRVEMRHSLRGLLIGSGWAAAVGAALSSALVALLRILRARAARGRGDVRRTGTRPCHAALHRRRRHHDRCRRTHPVPQPRRREPHAVHARRGARTTRGPGLPAHRREHDGRGACADATGAARRPGVPFQRQGHRPRAA